VYKKPLQETRASSCKFLHKLTQYKAAFYLVQITCNRTRSPSVAVIANCTIWSAC